MGHSAVSENHKIFHRLQGKGSSLMEEILTHSAGWSRGPEAECQAFTFRYLIMGTSPGSQGKNKVGGLRGILFLVSRTVVVKQFRKTLTSVLPYGCSLNISLS